MRKHPESPCNNSCGAVALAVFTPMEPAYFLRYGNYRGAKFRGMHDDKIIEALRTCSVDHRVEVVYGRRVRLRDALPVEGRGIALVRRGWREFHALAFDGKMVYDNSGQQWRWVYDDFWGRRLVRKIIHLRGV